MASPHSLRKIIALFSFINFVPISYLPVKNEDMDEHDLDEFDSQLDDGLDHSGIQMKNLTSPTRRDIDSVAVAV